MTVQELINALSALPPDHRVVVNGYEGGVNDVSDATECMIELNVNTAWYYGSHEIRRDYEVNSSCVPGVWIG